MGDWGYWCLEGDWCLGDYGIRGMGNGERKGLEGWGIGAMADWGIEGMGRLKDWIIGVLGDRMIRVLIFWMIKLLDDKMI